MEIIWDKIEVLEKPGTGRMKLPPIESNILEEVGLEDESERERPETWEDEIDIESGLDFNLRLSSDELISEREDFFGERNLVEDYFKGGETLESFETEPLNEEDYEIRREFEELEKLIMRFRERAARKEELET